MTLRKGLAGGPREVGETAGGGENGPNIEAIRNVVQTPENVRKMRAASG
jgi:hypothetical protein